MPEFKIRMPDGQIRTVRGPDREGAMAFAKANYSPTAAPTTAAPAEVNPEGTGFDRAVRRGAYQTAAALPTALATADVRVLSDKDKLRSPSGASAIKYDELIRAGVPQGAMASRGVNLEDDQGTARLMSQYGVSPQAQVNYGQVVDKRIENAYNVYSQDAAERIQSNAGSASYWQEKAAALPMSPGAGKYAEALSEAPDSFKGWLSTVTNDPVGFMTFLGETVAESAPQMAAGIATTAATGNPLAGATVMSLGGLGREYSNEVNSFLAENGVDLSDPDQAATLFKNPELMDKANERGLTRGLVIAAADLAGQGLVAQQIIKKSLTRQTLAQGLSEAAGESAATAAVGDKQSFKENIIEGLAGGASAAPQALVAGQSPWRSKIKGDPAYGGAAADLARTLREISEAQGNNLKDVRAGGGAKATLEAAHEKISGRISAIANNKAVKARLSPKNASTLKELLETYAAAQTAIRQGKNKVKSKVTKENADAIVRLLGPTKEAAQLQQLFDQGDVLTDLFQDGLKGGVSQFTDFLNPFTDNSGNYDPNRSLSTIGSIYGASVVGPLKSASIVAAGRAFDAATGRRSKVNRFVKKLEKLTGQDAPQGRSLIAEAELEAQKAEQAKSDNAAAKAAQEAEDANIVSTLAGMTGNATDGSPLGTVAVGTGIPTEEIQTVVSELRVKHPADSKNPNDVAVNKVLDDAQAGLNGEQRPIRALTQLVNIVNDHLNASLMDGGSSVQRTSLPDGDLARARAIQMGNAPKMDAAPTQPQTPTAPNVDTTAPAQPTVNGNQTTTSENYQAGIQANRDTALKLQEQVLDTLDLNNRQATNRPGGNLTPTMLEDEASALYVALEAVQTENMPLEAMEEVQQMLLDEGVAQENVDKFYKPYVDRVRRQQQRKPSMLKQAQATQEAIQGKPVVNTEAAPAPSVLEQAQALQQNQDTQSTPSTSDELKAALAKLRETDRARIIGLPPTSDQPMSDDSRGIPTGPFTPAFNKAEMINTSTLNSTIPKGNKPRYDVGKIDTVADYNAEDWMYDDFAKTGKPTLKESIFKEGIKEPIEIMVSKKTGDMVLGEGNHRLKAATELGMNEVPVVVYVKDDLGFIDGEVPAKIDTKGLKAGEYYSLSEIDLDSRMIEGKKPAGQGSFQYIKKDGTFSPEPDPTRYTPMRATAAMSDDNRSAPEMPTPPSVPEMPSGPALNQVNNPLQVSDADLDATNMTIMPSSEELSAMKDGTYKPTQKRTLVEFAQVLQDRWQKATGRTTPFEQTPENIDQISRLMATEAANALNSDSNAIGWYDRKLKAAKSVVSLVDPRVTESPENEAAFDYALAVTSNGQAVADNFEYAMSVFREFMDTGRMPTDTWIKGGERNQAMVDAFSFFNAYQDSGQNVPMRDFLDSDFTVSDLTKYIGQFNSQYGTNITVPSSEGATEMVKGSYIVGPKIGQGFYQNIRGNYDPLTMDIWWMRMWNRLNGRAFEDLKDLDKNRSTIRAELKSADVFGKQLIKETMSDMGLKKSDLKNDATLDAFVSKLDKRYQAFFRKSKKQNPKAKPPKPQLFKSTGTMVKNLVPQLQAQPKNAGERSYMRQVTKEALSKLSNIGINISTADFQALMWYPEKQLFRKGGVAPGRGSDNDYLDAAKMLATKEGITNEQIEEALPASERSGAINNIPGPEGQDGGLYTGPDESQTTADNSIFPALLQRPSALPGGTPRSNPANATGSPFSRVNLGRVKEFLATAKVPFTLGRKGSKDQDGIQTLDRALELARALGITVRLFDSQAEMYATRVKTQPGADKTSRGMFQQTGKYKGGKGAQGTIFALNPGSMLSTGESVSSIEALSTLLHEIAHGVTLGPMDGVSSQAHDRVFLNARTGNYEQAPAGSFARSALGPLLEQKGNADILAEIDNLQENVEVYTTNDPKKRHALRGIRQMHANFKPWVDGIQGAFASGAISETKALKQIQDLSDQKQEYLDYVKDVREMAVDPLLVYFINPKLAKDLMPKTAELIRNEFKKAGNPTVQFFNHPMAVIIATVMAMLAAGIEEEEEEQSKQQQMVPPGALSPPPQGMGALSA